jgi:hypothetical protein
MSSIRRSPRVLVLTLAASSVLPAQQPAPTLVTTGQLTISGHQTPYRIRYLPTTSFPDLPPEVALQLTQRSCLIPQTYEAHQPENVIHASLERPGSSDWAILCSAEGTVSLLVFFASAPTTPMTLATAPETQRLQAHNGTSILGFNWGIDPASPEAIRQAQIGLQPRPDRMTHDALADSVIDHATLYHYFKNGAWSLLPHPN